MAFQTSLNMKSGFETVLSHCKNRIQNENVQVIQISNGNIVKTGNGNDRDSNRLTDNTDVRPGIQNFIKQKSEENKKESNKDKQSDKSQILFSLKDFLDTASSTTKEANSQNVDEDDEVGELNEDDESLKDNSFNNSNESPKEEIDIADIDSDIEELERVDNGVTRSKGEDDLESEITKLENLQRKINDNLKENPKGNDINSANDTILLKMKSSKPEGPVKSTVPSNANDGEPKTEVSSKVGTEAKDPPSSEEIKCSEKNLGSSFTKSSTLPEGMFRNISISVVGGVNKNVKLTNLLGGKPGSTDDPSKSTSSSTKPQTSSMTDPQVPSSGGIKRPPPTSNANSFDTKRFKNSSIVITSSRQADSPISPAEASSKVDKPDVLPAKDESSKYDICTHSNSLGYLCHDCSFNRWRTGFEFVKTRKEKLVESVHVSTESESSMDTNKQSGTADKAATADILKNVNWQQVFSFAGISIGQSSEEAKGSN